MQFAETLAEPSPILHTQSRSRVDIKRKPAIMHARNRLVIEIIILHILHCDPAEHRDLRFRDSRFVFEASLRTMRWYDKH